jgi:elongation of very long chain fatty acids protein 6
MDHWLDATVPRVRSFTTHEIYKAVNDNGYVAPVVAVIVYITMVFGLLPMLRPSHAGPVWRHLFALWNLILSAFSCLGVLVCVPFVYRGLTNHGLHYMLCSDRMMWGPPFRDSSSHGAVGLMMTAFMLSKFPELIDTFFLVWMKKPVQFLHWYHHATVLMYSWFAYKNATPSAVIFATMNYVVHSIMYFYFGASSYTKGLSFLRMPITMLQLGQMAFGVGLTVVTYFYAESSEGCSLVYEDSGFFKFCGAMYLSYFVLFTKLFHDNYINRKSKKRDGRKAE